VKLRVFFSLCFALHQKDSQGLVVRNISKTATTITITWNNVEGTKTCCSWKMCRGNSCVFDSNNCVAALDYLNVVVLIQESKTFAECFHRSEYFQRQLLWWEYFYVFADRCQ